MFPSKKKFETTDSLFNSLEEWADKQAVPMEPLERIALGVFLSKSQLIKHEEFFLTHGWDGSRVYKLKEENLDTQTQTNQTTSQNRTDC